MLEKNLVGLRNRAVSSMKSLCMFYGFNSETLSTAVYTLDTFLDKMKVSKKLVVHVLLAHPDGNVMVFRCVESFEHKLM